MENLEWYRIFYHTAKSGSATRAAETLFITQPSVSYAIKQLENSLGIKLFHRLSRGVELTGEGQALFGYVEQSFQLLEAGEEKLQQLKNVSAGELRIGGSDSLFKHLLLPQLETYRARFPGVNVRLSHGQTSEIVQLLKEGKIDCGLIQLPLVDPLLLIREMAVLENIFVVGEVFEEWTHQPLSAKELSALPFLGLSKASSTSRFVDQWFGSQGISKQAEMELGSIDLLVELVKRGFGCAFVTRSFVREELVNKELFEVKTIEPIPLRRIGIATRQGMTVSMAAAKFLEQLEKGKEDSANGCPLL